MLQDRLEAVIGQVIEKAQVTEHRQLIIETSTHRVVFSEYEAEYDQGGSWLDVRKIEAANFIGAKILGYKYSPGNEDNPTSDQPMFYVTDTGPFIWELCILETDKGNLDIWFLCSDGGYVYGTGNLTVVAKS